MPLYVYEHDAQHGEKCDNRFEVLQGLHDEPLSQCPECGKPCHRVVTTFATMKGRRNILSSENLEKHGFTQYQRVGRGQYEKTCGTGPETLGPKNDAK